MSDAATTSVSGECSGCRSEGRELAECCERYSEAFAAIGSL